MTTTNRVLRTIKKITLSFSGINSNQLLADSDGNTRFELENIPNWSRIVIHTNLDSIASTSTTSITFALLTSCKPGKSGSTSDLAAVKANGSTTIANNHTAAGIKGNATGKQAADGSAASNIGSGISVYATMDATVTSATGSVDIYIEGQ